MDVQGEQGARDGAWGRDEDQLDTQGGEASCLDLDGDAVLVDT